MTNKENVKVVEDRLKTYQINQLNKVNYMLSKRNNLFFISMILLSIVTLVIAWVVESNTNGLVVKVFDGFDSKYIILILTTMIIIGLFSIVPDYIYVYKNSKQRRFFCILGATITQNYYNSVMLNARTGDGLYSEYLKVSSVDSLVARKLGTNKNVSRKISNVIYSLMLIVIGSIFAIKSINIFLYVLAIIGFIVSVLVVLSILYFDKYKAKQLEFIGKVCKLLYKCKIIKDYEKLYNNWVSILMHYGSVFKSDKVYLIIQICSGIICKFLKHLILFFLICAFNVIDGKILIEVLFKCTIFDLILSLLPLPNGILVYELIFLILFRSTFFDGYVLYGLVGYRVLTYFMIYILFGVLYLMGIRKHISKLKDNIKEELAVDNPKE